METKRPLPCGGSVGFDDVKVLIARGTYVDKSLFVKEIIDNTSGVLLITRPRRWGKSSNMSLLQTFLELEVDKAGNPVPVAKKRKSSLLYGRRICRQLWYGTTGTAQGCYTDRERKSEILWVTPLPRDNFKSGY